MCVTTEGFCAGGAKAWLRVFLASPYQLNHILRFETLDNLTVIAWVYCVPDRMCTVRQDVCWPRRHVDPPHWHLALSLVASESSHLEASGFRIEQAADVIWSKPLARASLAPFSAPY